MRIYLVPQIILDVRDFEQGSIIVKALHDTEILIEGKIEKKTNGSTMMKSFRRRFVMPGYIKSELVTSARSSDGIMTITAPKQVSNVQFWLIIEKKILQ